MSMTVTRLSDELVKIALEENREAIIKTLEKHIKEFAPGSGIDFSVKRGGWSDRLYVDFNMIKFGPLKGTLK